MRAYGNRLGVPFWGVPTHNKDYSIMGSILGFLILGNGHVHKYINIVQLIMVSRFHTKRHRGTIGRKLQLGWFWLLLSR